MCCLAYKLQMLRKYSARKTRRHTAALRPFPERKAASEGSTAGGDAVAAFTANSFVAGFVGDGRVVVDSRFVNSAAFFIIPTV